MKSDIFIFFAIVLASPDGLQPSCFTEFFAESGELLDMLEDRFFPPLLEDFLLVVGRFGSRVIDWSFFCGDVDADDSDT